MDSKALISIFLALALTLASCFFKNFMAARLAFFRANPRSFRGKNPTGLPANLAFFYPFLKNLPTFLIFLKSFLKNRRFRASNIWLACWTAYVSATWSAFSWLKSFLTASEVVSSPVRADLSIWRIFKASVLSFNESEGKKNSFTFPLTENAKISNDHSDIIIFKSSQVFLQNMTKIVVDRLILCWSKYGKKRYFCWFSN